MTGDRLVRICEGSRVKFLRSTRRPEESEAGPFPSLRDYFRAVLAVQGALCRAEKRRALDRSGPL